MNGPLPLSPQPPQDFGPTPTEAVAGTKHPTAAAVEQAIGITFRNPGLAVRAVTHSSFANENPSEVEDYERLEFLGDAVLDFLAAYWLYHHFPELSEGDLTRLRSLLVRTETLSLFARQLGLDGILRIGKGERATGGQNRMTILCGAFEALMGAIAMDRGMEAAYAFITPLFEKEAARSFDPLVTADSKSLFQEKAQAKFGLTPVYRVVELSGPDHDRRYTIEVLVGKESFGIGTGNSKQAAAQDAAQWALEKLQRIEAEGK